MASLIKPRFTTRQLMAMIAWIALLLGLFLGHQSGDVAEFGGIVLSTVGTLIVFVMLYFALWFGALALWFGVLPFLRLRHRPTASKQTSRP
jgi:fumarate reductase subunit D